VGRGRGALVDDVISVERGHLRATDREALQPALIDQRAGGLGAPAGVRKRRAAAGLVEGRARLPPPEQLCLELFQLGRGFLAEPELRFEDDALDVARPVLERDLLAGEL